VAWVTSLERATKNELRFRDANVQIEEFREKVGLTDRVPYLCECEDELCRQVMRLSAQEYRKARVDERHFILAPGHPFRSGGIVAECDGYVVVEKTGEAAEVIAREEHGDG
jgi:hypothetical protein